MYAITPDLISAKALDGYRLDLVFADGRCGVFDCSPYMQFEFMEGVREPSKFAEVMVDHGTASWPGGEDLCPDDLYCNLIEKEMTENYTEWRRENLFVGESVDSLMDAAEALEK